MSVKTTIQKPIIYIHTSGNMSFQNFNDQGKRLFGMSNQGPIPFHPTTPNQNSKLNIFLNHTLRCIGDWGSPYTRGPQSMGRPPLGQGKPYGEASPGIGAPQSQWRPPLGRCCTAPTRIRRAGSVVEVVVVVVPPESMGVLQWECSRRHWECSQ
jgi:hypothetical protein